MAGLTSTPTVLDCYENNFSVILPSDASIHPVSNQKAFLLPTPFITDVLCPIATGAVTKQHGRVGSVSGSQPSHLPVYRDYLGNTSNPFQCPFLKLLNLFSDFRKREEGRARETSI